jgi:hypothetical protein
MAERHFAEIPIYRVSEKTYNADREKWIDKHITELLEPLDSVRERWFRDHLKERFGGTWRYNQAVGFIRLFVFGGQIRGEYYFSSKQKLTRTGRRCFRWCGKAFQTGELGRLSCEGIRNEVRQGLLSFQKEYRAGKLELDLQSFGEMAKHLDWVALLRGD